MNTLQRGIYQPLADKVPIYDLADEDPDEERSRAPLLIVIALVVLSAFAGVVWIAYNQGVERGRQGASLVITAPEGPVRVAPPEAAATTPFTGLTVYNDPIPPEQEAKASALAPQAAPAAAEAPPIRLSQALPPPAPVPAPRPPAAQAPAPAVAPAARAPAAPTVQTVQAAPPAQPAALPAQPPPAAPAQAAGRALSGAAVLQIGAFESEELANGAWAAFRVRHEEAAQLAPDVQRADLGTKGVVYRLRVGPFSDRTAAADACIRLRAAGANCFVAAP